ncbi:MAG: monooxygenase [Nannocystis sp.]|nr:monooxygenase [Nannocystis sp.]
MRSPQPACSLAALAVLAALACNSGDDAATAATTGDASSTTSGASSTATTAADSETSTSADTAVEPALTYYRDIKPIVDAKCATCHRPGDIAPFSLVDYEQVSMMAPYVIGDITARTMPPWSPDAACRPYAHDRALTDLQITAILEWIELGVPAGDPADEPAPPAPPAPVDYDLELGLPAPYAPTVFPDEYRCFLLDWPKDQDSYVTAFEVVPGERAIVHHVIAFIIPPEDVASFDALDAADPGPGYPCYGGPGGGTDFRAAWLGAWVPGGGGGALPADTGIRIRPSSKLAVQMHYHPVEGAGPDQSQIKLRTAATVARPAYLLPLANPGWIKGLPPMLIPAGAADVVHSFEIDLSNVIQFLYNDATFGIGEPVVAHAAGVHMHTIGASASLNVKRGDGGDDTCLIDVPRWDFNWQGVYQFAGPTTINPTDKVRLECHFDNSAGDQPVTWGEGTGDEMCLGMVYVSAP